MSLSIGDWFCGGGLGALGAKQAGFEVGYAFDNNKFAVSTYNQNIENKAFVCDVNDIILDDLPDTDGIAAGFPCQPFSFSGNELGEHDPVKGDAGKLLCNGILYKKPKFFVLENVKGIISKRHKDFFDRLLMEFCREYTIEWKLINCADYGVPQKRERVFVVGIRKDLGKLFKFPELTHVGRHVSIREALKGLPPYHDNSIPNHGVDCGIRNDEKPYADKVPAGGNWKDLPDQDQKDFMGNAYYSSGGKTGFLWKVDLDKPAKTILSTPKGKSTAQLIQFEGYPTRRFTVRESLRLQSVPDTFVFSDDVPLMKQYERCSGIPPVVSKLIFEQIRKILEE